ncbi:MAG: hypothetical protein HGA90_01110 [Alphaproteobacteria bacterium]|nr:hypothetical protein [Alphaproteobacteria bacterium]
MRNVTRTGSFASGIVLALALLLAGCVSGRSATDTYTSRSGAVTPIETNRETCQRACNEDYERCSDRTRIYQDDRARDATRLFGVEASCRDDLKKCLPRCNVAR